MTRIITIIVLGIFLLLVASQIYDTSRRHKDAVSEFEQISEERDDVAESVANLRAQLDFFERPENLEKEIRARFNYKFPGEQTIILVPRDASSTPEQ